MKQLTAGSANNDTKNDDNCEKDNTDSVHTEARPPRCSVDKVASWRMIIQEAVKLRQLRLLASRGSHAW